MHERETLAHMTRVTRDADAELVHHTHHCCTTPTTHDARRTGARRAPLAPRPRSCGVRGARQSVGTVGCGLLGCGLRCCGGDVGDTSRGLWAGAGARLGTGNWEEEAEEAGSTSSQQPAAQPRAQPDCGLPVLRAASSYQVAGAAAGSRQETRANRQQTGGRSQGWRGPSGNPRCMGPHGAAPGRMHGAAPCRIGLGMGPVQKITRGRRGKKGARPAAICCVGVVGQQPTGTAIKVPHPC
jgi:hypothetical protein